MTKLAFEQSTNLGLHERLLEEARLISRFERTFGFPPPPMATEEPRLASVLRNAIESGKAPEGWVPAYGRSWELYNAFDEQDAYEGA